MKSLEFSYDASLVSDEEISGIISDLDTEIDKLVRAKRRGYDDDRASISLPDDEEMLTDVQGIVDRKSGLNPEYLIVVGIGGSNLGTIAVQEAVLGRLYNQMTPTTKILFADTVDSDHINSIIEIIRPTLEKGGSVIVDCVSKSGTTTETIANFQVILRVLRRHKRDYENYVVVTSDKGSKLWNLAEKKGFTVLEIPRKVGGRYSVFSPVGLFPLGLLGVDLRQLQEGARMMRDVCLQKEGTLNPSSMCAAIEFSHYRAGKNIFDLFLFSKDLESVGKWHRQLIAESLGKEFNKDGKRVNVGLTPTYSIGSTDLHSTAQLYLGGPYDKLTTFVSINREDKQLVVPRMGGFSQLVSRIQDRRLKEVMDAILEGTKSAFINDNRPFIEVRVPDKSESSISQLLQFKMVETILLGHLLNVDPFNQPNVENYKKETRKILSEK